MTTTRYQGNDKALAGIVLGVLTFWLFAQTTLNIGPAIGRDLGTPAEVMNIAIALSALFSGMFIVIAGGLADRVGRVRIAVTGNILGVIGSLLVGLACGPHALATTMLIAGRIFQGFSAAFVMPSTMALIKTYWHGRQRQRAVSMWSIGSWGGGGLTSLFGGVMAQTALGWRAIFLMSACVSVLSIVLMRDIPEVAPAKGGVRNLDRPGIASLALFVLTLLITITQTSTLGAFAWVTMLIAVVAFIWFILAERNNPNALVDFALFTNPSYTGATVSNFLTNATAGMIPVSLWVMQDAAGWTPTQVGYLTTGYAVFIIAFIRVGEKLLQRFGAKRPMIWGVIIVTVATALLTLTTLTELAYATLMVIAFCLYGLGLAFYATPSTDTALTALPEEKAGAGAGVYKMASSLGAAFGAAIPTAIFTATRHDPFVLDFITFAGSQDNLVVRGAGMIAMFSIVSMSLIALGAILWLIPKNAGIEE